MKNKIILTLIFSIFTFFSYSQISKGTFRVGPDIVYSSNTTKIDGTSDKLSASTLNFTLSTGYFLADNLEAGVNVGVVSTKASSGGITNSQSGSVVGGFVTYMLKTDMPLYFPISVGVAYNAITEKGSSSEISYGGLGYGIGGGMEYNPNGILGIRVMLNYNFGSLSSDDFNFELDQSGTTISIGANLYFSKIKE